MMKVSNRKTIANLSRKSLKANRIRNIVAVLAIALTAILFTALFTVGGSLVKSMQESTMRQVGTSAHGGYKFLTQEQYDAVCTDSEVKDISYNIIVGFGENPELAKTNTEIRYTEEKAAKWGFTLPTTGSLPESGMELATNTAVLDALEIPHELGETVHLEFTAKGQKHSDDFTLCGFWEADVAMPSNQVFVSREYCDQVASVITTPLYELTEGYDQSYYAGTINPEIWFSSSWDIEGQMNALSERCGFDTQYVNQGANWAYATAEVDVQMLALMIAFLLLVGLSGYLIIYNVFYLSVSKDIRFYGLLKTIGTTGKQLKRIVRRQAFSLCLWGIPLGLLCGYGCGRLIMPAVMGGTNMKDTYSISVSPLIFIGSALFALLTVWISCIRPSRLAAKVSPVEAVRYTGPESKSKRKVKKSTTVTPRSMAFANLSRDRKKTILVVLSLALSMILLNSTYTIVHGFDMEKYLQHMVVTDFLVTDASVLNTNSTRDNFEGVTPTVMESIKELPGLERMGNTYMHESIHTLSDKARENAMTIVEKNEDLLPLPYSEADINMLTEEGTMISKIYGVSESLFDTLELAEDTSLDTEQFLSGNYVIATAFFEDGTDRYYDVGDKVTIDFNNGNTKEYEVLAIGDIPRVLGPRYGNFIDVNFTLPEEEFLNQVGDMQPLCMGFNIDDAHLSDTETWINSYCENVEPTLDYESRDIYVQEFHNAEMTFTVVGGVLSFILGLIGILNFVNAEITSIIARRRELAMLQSVGMTGKQLRKMLVSEGLIYAGTTVLFTISLGSLISYFAVEGIAHDIWFFSYHFTLTPVLICIPILLAIAILVPAAAHHSFVKQSVVERLREAE